MLDNILELVIIIDTKLIHSVVKSGFMAPKQSVSILQAPVFWIQIQVEDKA